MGEVYRARDTRLGRDVALKIVTAATRLDAEWIQRFEQEAKLAGSLSHPNLVVVHDVGTEDGAPFLVTELLPGESLRERLRHGRIPLRSALEIATQVAEGLAAAHVRGVVHRDIKPENIFVTSEGRAKVLDFGIAKLTKPRPVEGTRNLLDTTLTPDSIGTRPGTVIGTPGYMSPEQVRGDPVDARTDIFSLGTVLYEMLGSSRAFPGQSFIESGHAILQSEPAPLPDTVPPWVDRVVRRCLEKEPARRFQSAADLAFALAAPTLQTSGSARALTASSRRARWTGLALLVGALMLVGGSIALTRRLGARHGEELPTFEQLTFREGAIGGARFASGERIVFSALFDGEPEEVFSRARSSPELQSFGLAPARLAAVSRKTGELAVLLGSESISPIKLQGTIALMPEIGGAPRELAEHVAWADWTGTGELAVARRGDGKMWIERPIGTVVWGTPGTIIDLRASPDGGKLAFINVQPDGKSELVVLDRANSASVLTTSSSDPLWSLAWWPDGQGLRFTTEDAFATRLSSVSLGGAVRPLYQFPGRARLQDIAQDGAMLVTVYEFQSHLEVSTGAQEGREISWFDTPGLAALSEDGRMVLFDDGAPGATSVLLRDLTARQPKNLGPGFAIALSPDHRTVAMVSPDHSAVRLVPTGPGATEQVPVPGLLVQDEVGAWSRDGKTLWFTGRRSGQVGVHLYSIEIATRKVLGPHPSIELLPDTPLALSPDEQRIAVAAPDRGISVHSLPDGPIVRISSIPPEQRPVPAGWASDDELWVGVRGSTPPALVRVNVRTGQSLGSRKIELRHGGHHEITDARISRDGSVVVVQYFGARARLELMRGIPTDR
jgi:eukaryotic-like serine/threonine-protein kinase